MSCKSTEPFAERMRLIQLIEDELRAGDGIVAQLIRFGCEEFERADGMSMHNHPRCLACADSPDVPVAFVEIYANKRASLALPIPICQECGRKSIEELQKAVRALICELCLPDAPVCFCE